MQTSTPDALILVYDGQSGVRSMLLDVVKKAVGREDCPLCAITYGPLGKRRAWTACEARLGIPIEELHRDELPSAWSIAHGDLPCILARTGGANPTVLVTRAAILACAGDVGALERQIRAALAPS